MKKRVQIWPFLLLVFLSVSFKISAQMYGPFSCYKSERCPVERPFEKEFYGGCLGCDVLESMYVRGHESDFEICKERETVDGYSRLRKCPENFFHDAKGNCVACDKLTFSRVAKMSDCATCHNREVVSVTQNNQEFLHCQLKSCPDEAPLSAGGDCFACEANVFPKNAKDACEKCPNRIFFPNNYTVFQNDEKRIYLKEDICILNEVRDPERPLFSLSSKIGMEDRLKKTGGIGYVTTGVFCEDCSLEHSYRLNYEVWADRCDQKVDILTLPEICARCPNREYVDGKCIFRYCPAGKINGSYYPLMGSKESFEQFKETCINCTFYSPIYTTEENCHQCPNKVFIAPSEGEWGKCLDCQDLEENPEYKALSSEEKARCPKKEQESAGRFREAVIIHDEELI